MDNYRQAEVEVKRTRKVKQNTKGEHGMREVRGARLSTWRRRKVDGRWSTEGAGKGRAYGA
jgi:hypothetical protein